jgi:small subunit ribosomal protein S18
MARKASPRKRPRSGPGYRRTKKRTCHFCDTKTRFVDYKDITLLRRYISDARAKIRGRRSTGNCQRHQNAVARAIKNAREMALLPYTNT